MNRRLLIIALFATTAYAADGVRPVNLPMPLGPLPEGWMKMIGNGPHRVSGKCEVGLDTQTTADVPQLFSVLCSNPGIPSFGGAQKEFDSTRYQGKRVRVSGWLKVTGVEGVVGVGTPSQSAPGEAGLVLSVGSPSDGIRRDRMSQRAIKGSTGWEYRDFVVDVPRDSRRLSIGFWLGGTGQLWVRNMQVEKVSRKVPVNFIQDDDPGLGLTLK